MNTNKGTIDGAVIQRCANKIFLKEFGIVIVPEIIETTENFACAKAGAATAHMYFQNDAKKAIDLASSLSRVDDSKHGKYLTHSITSNQGFDFGYCIIVNR